jgi:DNA-binding CsgD family transcriptional regulator
MVASPRDPAAGRSARSLLGRDAERRTVEAVLSPARDGLSGVLVVHGEPGIGKTALLDAAAASAADEFFVTRLAGVEAEMQMPCAAVHRLLIPFRNRTRLERRQRRALDSAFGLIDGDPAELCVVGLAALNLLADNARERPLLCIVDDAQWLDQDSLSVLALVGRRLEADGVALLFGTRDPDPSLAVLDGLPMLEIDRLAEPDARTLLRSVVGDDVDPTVEARIIRDTAGNPLAIRELARDLSPSQLRGSATTPDELPLSDRVEASFLRQIRRYPPDAQLLALVAAADGTGDPSVVLRAAETLGMGGDIDEQALEHLLVLRPHVRFRHPLVRTAVVQGALPADVRRVHAALASALDPDAEPDRWAWHRAAAAEGPDESVASLLAASAARARARGGPAIAARLLARAAELTPDEATRRRRFTAAAESALIAGDPHAAISDLEAAHVGPPDPVTDAEIERLDGLRQHQLGETRGAYRTLLRASDLLAPIDRETARRTLLEALDLYLTNRLLAGPEVGDIALLAERVAALRTSDGAPTPRELLLAGFTTRYAVGYTAAAPTLKAAVRALVSTELAQEDIAHQTLLGFFAALEVWDDAGVHAWTDRALQTTRAIGALPALRLALVTSAAANALFGDLERAERRHAEHDALGSAVSGAPHHFHAHGVELLALRGDEAATIERANAMIERHDAEPNLGTVLYAALNALAILHLGAGRYHQAVEPLRRIFAADPPRHGSMQLPDMVEAGVRGGDPELATSAFARLDERARASNTPWGLGLLARSRALLAGDDEAEPAYLEAIDLLGETRAAPAAARAHLLYGEWLRRQRRRSDARRQLRLAFERFDQMGQKGFAERARIELSATGEHARKRSVEFATDLTPQETQIARLAAANKTNREIAAQLFISSSTVEYHLHNVYRKLQIESRRQLADALGTRRLRAGPDAKPSTGAVPSNG